MWMLPLYLHVNQKSIDDDDSNGGGIKSILTCCLLKVYLRAKH